MISVLLADDEYLIRSLVRNSIDWPSFHMEIVGEAGDGEEALEMIKTLRPQIAVVDINMPIINGLELVRLLREEQLEPRIIFLTGYRDFEYAKQAVSFHAADYLLKPFSAEEMSKTLVRLQREIEEGEAKNQRLRSMERESFQGRSLLREQTLRRLARGQRTSQPQLQELDISLQPEKITAIVIEVKAPDDQWTGEMHIYSVQNILQELLQDQTEIVNVCPIIDQDDTLLLLCNTPDAAEARERFREIWDRLMCLVEAKLAFSLTGGVSQPVEGYGRARTAIRAAMDAMNGRFYKPENSLFFFCPEECRVGVDWLAEIRLDELQGLIYAGLWEEGRQLIAGAMEALQKEEMRPELFRVAAMNVLVHLYAIAAKNGLLEELLTGEGLQEDEAIERAASAEETSYRLLAFYARFTEVWRSRRSLSKPVRMAREYIQGHYRDPELALSQIASASFAAPSYLSSLFKKEIGISTTEYITQCRMKEAARLLRDPERGLAEVSAEVGYQDPYYFSRCFKKYYGATPSKFIASHAGASEEQ